MCFNGATCNYVSNKKAHDGYTHLDLSEKIKIYIFERANALIQEKTIFCNYFKLGYLR